jgi:hypothetical protein
MNPTAFGENTVVVIDNGDEEEVPAVEEETESRVGGFNEQKSKHYWFIH